ncbi:DUF5895 domain-containing protein [Aliterella atlantica]|uniref:DUF5895 domain-containing protein n=1 Tax=Aliterella atlantica CENA595 TaxID=1618023 RepID=A0A0D8ZSV2_9CYAN|nr:DUF5895 domain-containing protein [Aliterella atlantica]KJH70301.1 hypothetical protein UH38_18465 [Aliterella atlantica CENA595]
MNLPTNFDFEDDKFNAPPSQVIPWCQIVNPRYDERDLLPYGLAIKLDNARTVGFTPDANWQQIEYAFSTGEIQDLYISKTPRLVIVRRGPLSLKNRETGEKIGTFKDNYDAFIADKLKFKTYTRHLIFIVGEDKKLLHKLPLQLTVNGASGTSFSKAYYDFNRQNRELTGFVSELEKAYASYRNQPVAAKGSLFHAHGIFCPTIEPEERGNAENTALVAATVDYGHPTADTLTQFLIASDSHESAIITQMFEEYKEFGKEQIKVEMPKLATAGASSSYTYPEEDEFDYPPY